MKEYKIIITETLEREIEIEANTRLEAQAKVKAMYDNEEIILYPENYAGTEIRVADAPNYNKSR